jgi:hypothetical protein
MHRIFEVDELVRKISLALVDQCKEGSVASLACVRKDISEIALDALWKDMNFINILYLIPAEAIRNITLQKVC